jgi:hypothetical protein
MMTWRAQKTLCSLHPYRPRLDSFNVHMFSVCFNFVVCKKKEDREQGQICAGNDGWKIWYLVRFSRPEADN